MAGEKRISGELRLYLDDKPIFDATGCTLSLSRETTTTPGTKDTAAGAPKKGTKSFTVGFNGLGIYAGDGNGGHNFKDLVDLFNDDSSTKPVAKFIPDEADYQWYYQGECIITALEGVFNFSEDSTITLSASGAAITPIDKNVTPPLS